MTDGELDIDWRLVGSPGSLAQSATDRYLSETHPERWSALRLLVSR